MAMIQCPNCNSTIDDTGAAFCPNCGTPLQKSVEQPAQEQPPVNYQPPAYQQPGYQPPAYQPPVYQQPVYQQPVAPERSGNGIGTAGFVLGLIALIFTTLAYVFFQDLSFLVALGVILLIFAVILAFVGMILSIVGVCKRNRTKVLAILGLVFSVAVFVLFIVLASAFGWIFAQIM